MTVIAASSITQSGSTISGDAPTLVIVQTDPGYAPNPGHAGTGTVVAIVCQTTPSNPLTNISTRLRVETGNNVLISGFVITGSDPTRILVRASGPSLPIADRLADPILELRDSAGRTIAANDNWLDAPNVQAIVDTSIPPANTLEPAILMNLNPGGYTAIVRGASNGTGVAIVEVYDLDQVSSSKLTNISSRGFVQTGDNVLIGGLMVPGHDPVRVIVRAVGPSLGVAGALIDPILELRDSDGRLIASNDNWRSDQEAEILATGIAPTSDLESAITRQLLPGKYTAIVRGVNGSTGIALVEVYGLR